MKLYVYGKCTICLGTNKTWYNRGCPYCDNDARQFFEAARSTVMTYILENFDENERKELITLLEQNPLSEEEE